MTDGGERALPHRHLDYDESVPVVDRGLAALDDLLERGDLDDWAPVAAAIRAEPRGRVAEAVLGLCRDHPIYGTSVLWQVWIERLRDATPAIGALAELRRRRGLRQSEVADRLGVNQSEVSRVESRRDVRVSTLRAYIAATGGELFMRADYPDQTVEITTDPNRRP